MSLKINPILPKQPITQPKPKIMPEVADKTKQTNQAINRLAIRFGGDDETKPPKKTVNDFYRELLKNSTLEPKDANKMFEVEFSVGKSPKKAEVEDYRKAFDTKLLTIAGYKMLDEREIGLARNLMKTDDSWTLKNIGSQDAKDGRQDGNLKVRTSKFSLEHAKIVGQAVLQFREYESKLADENKAKAESETNQMLLDPIRLGFNTPVNWLERTLNTPRDLLQQADKAELTPFSSTAKYIGKSIAEKIVGKELPEMPTFSQNVKNLTGLELPSIPEVKLPRPFEYQTEKYKREAKIGEDLGATAIDLFLLKRGIFGKPSATPQSLKSLGALPEVEVLNTAKPAIFDKITKIENTTPLNPKFTTKEMLKNYVGEETGKIWGTKVKYLNPFERTALEVFVKDGKLVDTSGKLYDTTAAKSVFGSGKGKAIFVMDESGKMYISQTQTVGKFHHSSFLSGKPIASAGEIVVENGKIIEISNRSGHYQPTQTINLQIMNELKRKGIDTSNIKITGF